MSVAGSKRALEIHSWSNKLGRSRRGTALLAAATVGLISVAARGQSLAPGVYVDQIGDGTQMGDSTTQQPLFIDSFAPGTNAPLPQIALPTTTLGSVHAITEIADETGGTGYAQAVMQASPDGRYLVVGGTNTGTTRTVAAIDSFSSMVNTGSISFASAALPRSVEMVDASHFYYDGNKSGLRYLTAPSGFITANVGLQRTVSIIDGQLFESGNSSTGGPSGGVNNGQGGGGTAPGGAGIAVVGSGVPGSTAENEAYIIQTGADPEQFVMLDQNSGVGFNNSVGNPGTSFQTNLDLCYVATDNGVEKYIYDGTTWNKTETIAPTVTDNKITSELVGLTYAGKDDSGNNVLYATTAGDFRSGTNEGNALLRLVDTGPTATWQVVQESTTNTWLRGVAAIDEPGDANGDFHVDSSDFAVIAANYGKTVTGGFADGDFNYDGIVNALDFNALATNFGYDPNAALAGGVPDAALGAVVPEPIGLSVLLLGGLAMGRRRKC